MQPNDVAVIDKSQIGDVLKTLVARRLSQAPRTILVSLGALVAPRLWEVFGPEC